MKTLLCSLLLAACTSMAFAQFPPLVAHYKLNGSGADASGNQNHGQVAGPISTADQNGIFPQAYQFDGVDDYILLQNNANPFSMQKTLPISIVAWVNVGGPGLNCVFKNDFSLGYYSGVWLNINANQQVVAGYGDGGLPTPAHRRTKIGSTSLQFGNWYHVAVVIKGEEDMEIYINGTNDCGTYSGTGQALDYYNVVGTIGRSSTSSSNNHYFDGKISEVRMFDGELTESQVQTLAGGGNPNPCCDLTVGFTPVYNGNGTFTFVNTTSGVGPYFSEWNFGDNSILNVSGPPANQSHTYTSSGSYQVCLTVYDENLACEKTYCDYVHIGIKGGRFAERSTPAWSLYPNPAADKVQLQWTERSAELRNLQIFDMAGRIVRRQPLPPGSSAKVDVSDLPSGVYILQIEGSDQREKLQIIH